MIPPLAQLRRAGFALLVLVSGSVHAELPATVAQALQQAGIPESHVGILVSEIGKPSPLLAHGEMRSLNPASVMKLVTTLAALDTLGPAHTFKTRVLLDGALEDGILRGNLVLRGGGDPALTLERFWLLLREIRLLGIREIHGNVILDNQYYQLDPIDPAAFDHTPLKPYNAPPSALLVNYNTLQLRIAVSENGIVATLAPAATEVMSGLIIQIQGSNAPCNGWRGNLIISQLDENLVLSGEYPRACGNQGIALNLLSPELTVAAIFNAIWKELGGRLAGRVLVGIPEASVDKPAPRLLLEYESPPLAQLIRDINKHSNNVMAKMLFLNFGATRLGPPATWEKSGRALRTWVQERGFDMPELVLDNGSGLSRIERISATSLAQLLNYAATGPAYYEFAASLPAMGLEGTQKARMNGSLSVGNAWLKSGTLNGARNLAGYVLGPDGRRRILIMLINHANAAAGDKAQDALVEWALQ